MIVLQPITTQQTVKAIPRSHNINSDLVVNGNFANGESNWTKEGDVSIENGLATFSGTDELSRIIQNNVMTIGKQYQWTYEIKTKTSGALRTSLFVNNDSNVDIPSELGFNTLQGVAFGTRISIKRHTDPTNISITNISVREANTSDLISVILTEEGTQRTETLTNVPFLSNLYYVNFYLTFSILKEDNFYTLEFIKDSKTIHNTKAYCTTQDPKEFSINNTTYTSNTDDTQYVTL